MATARDTPDLLAAIESGTLAPIYCLHGEERFFVDRCLAALRKAVLGPDGERAGGFNLDTFDLREKSLAVVLDAARTLPMFAPRRLVIARGIDELDADDLEPLGPYVADPNPSTCLVLVANDRVDGRLRAFGALRKAGFLHELPHLKDWQLPDWLVGEARRRKIPIEGEAARALSETAGPDLGRLTLALEQVALYAGPGVTLTAAHVEAMVPETRERNIFELTKAIGAGNRERALHLLANMLRNREPPLRIQFMLLRQVRQIWRAKEMQAAGAPRGEIAAKVGMRPDYLDEVLGPARRISTPALERNFQRLAQAERTFKGASKMDLDIQITRLVRSLADEAAPRR